MKYITTETEDGVRDFFTFSSNIDHDAMAESLTRIRDKTHGDWKRVTRTPISAGFVKNGICFGSSMTLGLQSDEGDTALLRNQ